LAALVIVQPDCAGLMPPVPVSWYGVARPLALSGFAGTMMSQLTLAAAVVAVEPLADGAALAEELALALAPRAAWLMVEFPPRKTDEDTDHTPSATGMAADRDACDGIPACTTTPRGLRPVILCGSPHVRFRSCIVDTPMGAPGGDRV
jgi:hypothetical protein